MKNKFVWLSSSMLIVATMLIASCATTPTTSASTSVITSSATSTISAPVSTLTLPPTSSTSSVSTIIATTTSTGNWWDSLPQPQYGSTLTFSVNTDITGFDFYLQQGQSISPAWLERLFTDNWTMNPTEFAYQLDYRPNDYVAGQVVQNWEFTSPNTFVMQIRQGIYWDNIAPANGREFVASDVVWNYDRMYGLGGGFTTGSPVASQSNFADVTSITATGQFTVTTTWNSTNPELIYETIEGPNTPLENPEAVQLWGNVENWHDAVGTGPFILTDFVDGTSATLVKNTNYWGYDERYPQNRLPYLNGISVLIIPQQSTALAAVRAGKIAVIDGISYQDAQAMKQTNPEIQQVAVPGTVATTINPRNDVAPFNNLSVREAMQLSIDLPTIASGYYGGSCSPYPATLTDINMTGWGFPYPQWSASLQAEYSYNPTEAKQLLAQAGYPNGFNTDIVAEQGVDMDLLQIAQSYFLAVGIKMSINVMTQAAWMQYVQTNHAQDQISEKINGTLGLDFEPLIQLKRFTTGYTSNTSIVNDPVINTYYTSALAATNEDTVKQIVTQANDYVAEQHLAVSLLTPTNFAFNQPWIHGYNDKLIHSRGQVCSSLAFMERGFG